jgi:hypothetical protein
MPMTNAERQKLWRERKAGRVAPPERRVCSVCKKRGCSGAYEAMCRRCWEKVTVEGRKAHAERNRRSRAAKKAAQPSGLAS